MSGACLSTYFQNFIYATQETFSFLWIENKVLKVPNKKGHNQIYFWRNFFCKERVRIDQTRCGAASVEKSFGLDFFVTFFIKKKSKNA